MLMCSAVPFRNVVSSSICLFLLAALAAFTQQVQVPFLTSGVVNAYTHDPVTQVSFFAGKFDVCFNPAGDVGSYSQTIRTIRYQSIVDDGRIFNAWPDGENGWIIAGSFTKIDGQERNGFARLDANSKVTSWTCPVPYDTMRTTNVIGRHIYTMVKRLDNEYIIKSIDIGTGTVRDMAFTFNAQPYMIHGLDTVLVAAGPFTKVNGKYSTGLFAFNPVNSKARIVPSLSTHIFEAWPYQGGYIANWGSIAVFDDKGLSVPVKFDTTIPAIRVVEVYGDDVFAVDDNNCYHLRRVDEKWNVRLLGRGGLYVSSSNTVAVINSYQNSTAEGPVCEVAHILNRNNDLWKEDTILMAYNTFSFVKTSGTSILFAGENFVAKGIMTKNIVAHRPEYGIVALPITVDGEITAMYVRGNNLYLAGKFNYVKFNRDSLYCRGLTRIDMSMMWQAKKLDTFILTPARYSPFFEVHDRKLYVTGTEEGVICIDSKTGEVLKNSELLAGAQNVRSLSENALLVQKDDAQGTRQYVVDTRTNKILWSVSEPWSMGNVHATGKTVFVGSTKGLGEYDLETGALRRFYPDSTGLKMLGGIMYADGGAIYTMQYESSGVSDYCHIVRFNVNTRIYDTVATLGDDHTLQIPSLKRAYSSNGTLVLVGSFSRVSEQYAGGVAYVYVPRQELSFRMKEVSYSACLFTPVNAEALVSDGQRPYRYIWSNVDGSAIEPSLIVGGGGSSDSSIAIQVSSSMNVMLSVTDAKNRVVSDTFSIDLDPIHFTVIEGSTSFTKNEDGIFTASALGHVDAAYQWLPIRLGEYIGRRDMNEVVITWKHDGTDTVRLASYNTVSGCSDTVSLVVVVGQSTDVDDDSEGSAQLSVSPNPVNGRCRIDLARGFATVDHIDVVDIHGTNYTLPYNRTGNPEDMIQADLSSLPQGIYIVRVHGANMQGQIRSSYKRIIVAR